ncbi:MAG: septum formation initiator family protein [Alphaproteobacteria bacterium]|mgnify:CR=1 FL=1|jgi:cell division protein FtsB|nr:septum formation initiator family protein [Alphaproteobacteria bacterium]MBT5389278.1 septum formation initiator family protein [Alphaproteobacteria bacterium]
MFLAQELKRRSRHIVAPLFAFIVCAYFVYHFIQGDRGILAWHVLRQKLFESHQSLDETERKRKALDQKVSLLKRDQMSLDMLKERAYIMLNYGRPDEVVIHMGETKGNNGLKP